MQESEMHYRHHSTAGLLKRPRALWPNNDAGPVHPVGRRSVLVWIQQPAPVDAPWRPSPAGARPARKADDEARWQQRLQEIQTLRAAGGDWPRHQKTDDAHERTLGLWLRTQRIDYQASHPLSIAISALK